MASRRRSAPSSTRSEIYTERKTGHLQMGAIVSNPIDDEGRNSGRNVIRARLAAHGNPRNAAVQFRRTPGTFRINSRRVFVVRLARGAVDSPGCRPSRLAHEFKQAGSRLPGF
jgi:hypothetical protein